LCFICTFQDFNNKEVLILVVIVNKAWFHFVLQKLANETRAYFHHQASIFFLYMVRQYIDRLVVKKANKTSLTSLACEVEETGCAYSGCMLARTTSRAGRLEERRYTLWH
jgi:hypothetical protein